MFDQNKNLLKNSSTAAGEIFDAAKIIPARAIFQNKPAQQEQPKSAPTDKPADPNAPKEEAKKPEVVDQSAEAKKIVVDKMQTDIRLANANLKSVDAQLTPKAEEYLQNYFQSSIDRFDADKDGKISKEEAEKYKAAMFAKTKSLIDEYAPTEEQKKATEAKNTAAKAIESPDVTSKNLSEIKEISDALDIATSLTEFESMQTQNSSFQSSISASIQSIQSFHGQVANFQKAQEGWRAFSHAANEMIHPFSESDGAKKERELKASIAAAKASGEAQLTDLKAKKSTLDANGEKIKSAIAAERKKMIADRDAKVAEMKSTEKEQGEKIAEKKKKYDEIKKKQDDLIKQKQTLEGKQAKQAEFQKSWSQVKETEQWDTRKKAFTESKGDATAEMDALKLILDDEHLTPEMKTKIQSEYDAAAARQKSSDSNVNLITERIETGKVVDRQLTEDEKNNATQVNSVAAYLKGQVEPALTSTSSTIGKLEELKMQYATQAVEVTDYYNKKVDQMDKINESVSDNILASAVGRDKSINALQSAVKSLDSLDVDNRGIFRSVVLGLPQGLLHGIGEGCHDLGAWIDKNTGFVLDNTTGGWNVLAQTGAFFTGFLSGGIELVGGVFTMAAHPWETVKGLTSLVGYDSHKGEWSTDTLKATWKHLGSSLVGGDEWEKGHYGTSGGKLIFNVLSMFVGAGEAKAAGEAGVVGRAAAAASKARIVAVAEAVAKGASETWMLGRGAQIVEFAKTLAIEATPKFAKNAYEAGAQEVGFLGKTGAVFKSLGGSIAEATPQFLKEAWKKGVDATGVLGKPLAVAKSLGISAAKGIGNVALFTGKIYKELLMAPVSAVRATARFVRELPTLARRIGSEGLVNVYRASKLSEAAQVVAAESGNFAKAREAIAEIIEKDPKLSLLAQEGEAGAKAAEAQASLKLLREQPALFDSYIKMEKATAQLNEYGTAMAEDIKANIKKVKENPEVAFEVAEHNKLKDQYDAAKAKYEKTPKPNGPAPAPLEVKVVDAKAYAEAESEFTQAKDKLQSFEKDRKHMDKVDSYYKAEQAETELADLLGERKQLQDKYVGAPKEPLSRLEREVGEARAVRDSKITAITDSPEFIEEARGNFEKAIKSGNVDEIEKATSAFGTFEPNSELSKMLDAIKRKMDGKPLKPGYVDQNFYQKFDKPFKDALKSGNMEEIAALRKNPEAAKYSQYFDFMEYKYYSETADLRTVFQRNQQGLLKDYELYQQAIQGDPAIKDATATRQALREKHPAWKDAFDEMDLRQNYLLHNDVITHKISAVRIKAELPDLIKPGMKAEEAASKLRKRYANQPMGADAIGAEAGELILEGKTYKVRLEGAGDVKLIAPDGSIVKTLEEVAADAKAAKSGTKAVPVEAPAIPPEPIAEPALAKTTEPLEANSAAKTGPEKPATMRRDEALDLLESSKKELDIYKKALRDQEANFKLAEETYLQRKASGKFSDKALEGMKNKMESAKDLVAKSKTRIAELEETISTARKDKWVARGEVAADKALDYITSSLRSKWLENAIERLKKVKGIPGEIGEALATFLKEQAASKYASIRVFSEKGLNIARKLKNYWDKTRDQSRPLSRLYNEVLDDQLVLLSLLSKSVAKNLDGLKALDAGAKIAAVEKAWGQLAEGGGTLNQEQMYSEADLDYLKDKKTAVRDSIESLSDQEGVTAADVQAAIDAKLGPEGNDTAKSYTVTVDGVTVKVDQDGHRTYEGLEKWVADTPNKKLVVTAFREVATQYNSLDQKSALKLNGGKPYASKEELQKQVEGKLKAQILEKIKGQDLKGGVTVFSKERTSADQPNFVAHITDTGKVTLDINDKWIQQIYDQSTGKVPPPAGASPDVPVVAPKSKGPGKGPRAAPQNASPDLISKKGETTEPDQNVAPPSGPVDATATYDKPKPQDDFPDPNNPYS